jgi:hypothetical protein
MKESIFVLASVAVFAVIGMLTGYLHGHGEIAGTVCGGLGGLILAIMVPAILATIFGTSFMAKGRFFQYCVAVLALILLVVIVCVMYEAWFVRLILGSS